MLRAIYKGGSSVILPRYRDKDYFYYYDTNDERKEALINNKDHSVDNHYKLWDKRLSVFIGCYNYPFMQHVSGEVIEDFKTFNICDHKHEYKEAVSFKLKKLPKQHKHWYHLVIAYYMFQNNSNTITKNQLKVAQETHDYGISDYMYSKVIDYFNQID